MPLTNPSLNSSEAGAKFLHVCVMCGLYTFLHSHVDVWEMKRTFYQEFDTFDNLMQEDPARLIVLSVGFFFLHLVLKCSLSELTHHLSIMQLLFLLISVCDSLFGKAKQRFILRIGASVFVLPPPFCSNAELCEAEGIQTLSASAALPLPLACFLFLCWPKYFRSQKGY